MGLTTTTPQETLNHVVLSLREQGRPSAIPDEEEGGVRCLYRGPDGTKCAAGHCIPDELYSPAFEGKAAGSIDVFPKPLRFLLDRLQTAHDQAAEHSPNNWLEDFERRARKVANIHHLTYPEA